MRHWLIGLTAALALTGAAQAQTVAGDWHGALTTPVGDLRAVVKIKAAGSGFDGVMLSPDQSSTELPLAEVKRDDQTLTFAVPRVRATYEGRWNARTRAWDGTWTQGGRPLPLTLLAGDLPKGPVIAGLDGDWAGEIAAETAKLRVVLHVRTGPYGTVASLDSPDQLVAGLPAAIARDGAAVTVTVKAVGLSYAGVLNGDGDVIAGSSKQGDRSNALVLRRRARPSADAGAALPLHRDRGRLRQRAGRETRRHADPAAGRGPLPGRDHDHRLRTAGPRRDHRRP